MSGADDWAIDFFSGTFVEVWLSAIPELQTIAEVDFLEKVLDVPPAVRILDLACGGGRHCLELAARGYQPTGVDLSPEFLAAARSAAEQRKLAVAWEQRAMHDLPWRAEFDAAICLGNSLGGLDDAGLATFFGATAQALKPGARLVVNTGFVAESLLPHLRERQWFEIGDILFLAHRRYDVAASRLNVDYTFIRNGQVERKSAFGQVHTYKEFCLFVTAAGFHSLQGFASTAQDPYQLGSPELFVVATRE